MSANDQRSVDLAGGLILLALDVVLFLLALFLVVTCFEGANLVW